MPPAWTFQWLYLLSRWILALYFGGWLLYYAIEPGPAKGDKFMIYLTNWGFLFWVAYLISAAVAVTVNFIRAWACNHVLYFPRRDSPTRQLMAERDEDEERDTTANCCRKTPDSTNFCDKITWFLFLVGAEAAVLIALLFWTMLYNIPGAATPLSVHLHLVNAVVAILDLWVSGVPIFLLQFIYIQIFGATYVSFTGVYYAFGNTSAIYPVLDYEANPGLAAGLAVGTAVFGTVIVHLIFLAQYLCRRYATSRLLLKYKKTAIGSSSSSDTTPIL